MSVIFSTLNYKFCQLVLYGGSHMASQVKNWYILSKGKKVGPMSEQNIILLYGQKKINSDTKVAKSGMKAWVPLSKSGILDPDFGDLPPIPEEDEPTGKSAKNNSTSTTILAVVCSVIAVVVVAFVINAILSRGGDSADSPSIVSQSSSPLATSPSPPLAETTTDTPASTEIADTGRSTTINYPASQLSISGQTVPPDNHVRGKVFPCKGVITSDYDITSVTAGVFDSNDNMVTGDSANPNTKSYDFGKTLDNNIRFDWLTEGSYIYKVIASDASGNTLTLVEKPFTVESESGSVPSTDSTFEFIEYNDTERGIKYTIVRDATESVEPITRLRQFVWGDQDSNSYLVYSISSIPNRDERDRLDAAIMRITEPFLNNGKEGTLIGQMSEPDYTFCVSEFDNGSVRKFYYSVLFKDYQLTLIGKFLSDAHAEISEVIKTFENSIYNNR